MAKPTLDGLEGLFLEEKPLWQPPINSGPFIVTHYPRTRYPENIIVSFNDYGKWGKILFKMIEESYKNYSLKIETNPNELYVEEKNLAELNKKLLEEAKELDAMTMYHDRLNQNMRPDKKFMALATNTFVFMMNYFYYQDHLLYSHIEQLRKEALKNYGGETK